MCVRRLEASRDIALKKMAAAPLSTEELADPWLDLFSLRVRFGPRAGSCDLAATLIVFVHLKGLKVPAHHPSIPSFWKRE